jgi:hypothetical protein
MRKGRRTALEYKHVQIDLGNKEYKPIGIMTPTAKARNKDATSKYYNECDDMTRRTNAKPENLLEMIRMSRKRWTGKNLRGLRIESWRSEKADKLMVIESGR